MSSFISVSAKVSLARLIKPYWRTLSARDGSVPNSNKQNIWRKIRHEWNTLHPETRCKSVRDVRDRIWAKMKSRATKAKKINRPLDIVDRAVIEATAHDWDNGSVDPQYSQAESNNLYIDIIRQFSSKSGCTSADLSANSEDSDNASEFEVEPKEIVLFPSENNKLNGDANLDLSEGSSTQHSNAMPNSLCLLTNAIHVEEKETMQATSCGIQTILGGEIKEPPSISDFQPRQGNFSLFENIHDGLGTTKVDSTTQTEMCLEHCVISKDYMRFLQGLETASRAIVNFRKANVIPEISSDGSLICRPVTKPEDLDAVIKLPNFVANPTIFNETFSGFD